MQNSVSQSRLWQSWSFVTAMAHRPVVGVAMAILAAYVVLILFADWIAPYDPNAMAIVKRLKPPSAEFFFGTDEFGRDVFSRTLHAGRISFVVGGSVVLLATVAGTILGLAAGFFARLDPVVSRLIDAMMAFPDILLAIALVAALGPSVGTVIVALAVVYTPRVARVVRASTLVIRELPYVDAARAMGITRLRIMYRHVLRNAVSPILVQSSFVFASAILSEAGLSFLGLGVNPEIATWGGMISSGRQYLGVAGWLMLLPGCVLVGAVLSLLIVGDGLRDALDPRLKRMYE